MASIDTFKMVFIFLAKKNEIYRLTENLLESIRIGDYETYCKLVSSELTCFEPETKGHLVKGLDFHKFYFENSKPAIVVIIDKQLPQKWYSL